MESSTHYSTYTEISFDSNNDYESYGYSEINDSLKDIYNSIQAYKAGFNDREYMFYD